MAHLGELLGRVRRRWFAAVALRTIGLAAGAAALPALAAVGVDRILAPEGPALILLGLAAALLSLAAAAVVVARIERRPDDRRVARFVEERAAHLPQIGPLEDALVSAVDASAAGPEHAAFASLVAASALRRLEGVSPSDLVTAAALRRSASIALAGSVVLALVIAAGGPSISRALETARLRWFPDSVSIEVLPGTTRLAAGRPLTVRARIRAGSGTFSQLQPMLVVSAAGDQRAVPMPRAGDSFEFRFESVDRTFAYRVKAGPIVSPEFTVTAIFPPRVKRIELQYQYPSFSGLPPRQDDDGGDIYAPAGTRVRVRIHTDKPIASGRLTLRGGAVSLQATGERVADADLVLSRDDSYRVSLADLDGLTSDGDSEYFIRLMDDRPPDVRILRPSSDQGITPLEEVTVEARADDDYGVSSLELVYSVSGGKEHAIPFSRIAGTPIQKLGSHLLAAEELRVKPGDVITYYARARDVGRGKRSTETKSDMFFLEVKPFNEEFVAAQSQAGGGAPGDPQLDSLISAQKEIISATWNIERRSEGGRSADDIAAIAQAQAELKARAERMAGVSRGRRFREPAPQRPAPQLQPQGQRPGATDGVAAAVEAMTRAVEQLGSRRTRDAIPHEMAALNGLLQAQAEVRRRQVTQQANSGGGGGGNRSGQDLSALFDKELQRQQRTNYEQRTRAEERPDQPPSNDDALDRVKELARRQEELNRRQRELEKLSAEERKRELEKLTRDQAELRQQAEELSRQNGQQSGLKDAAEQMRAAAGDMRREDQEAARQSGQRAAEGLRRAEQQMRGGSADAKRRQTGELQSEAQQIAQEQRRIASEAERLEKGGESSTEARRRLAGEKEKLAERVDELQRAAREAGRDPSKGTESAAARDAAGELERQRIADRMRQSAQQMRAGSPAGKSEGKADGKTGKTDGKTDARPQLAQTEQQLARALDGVVDKLGGSPSADARKLAQELDRTRQLRDKLDRLEKQMREAQGKNDGEAAKLQQQYRQELGKARESLGRLEGPPRDGLGNSTPEREEYSQSAPGTEAFKQDRSGWESLRKDLDRALEQHDAAVSRRLAGKIAEAKMSAGGSDRVPEEYRRFISRYFESLAKVQNK
jgi:hypothetical protein